MKLVVAGIAIATVLTACAQGTTSTVKDDSEESQIVGTSSELAVGRFTMFQDRDHRFSGCDVGVSLTLDKAELQGDIAVTTHFVDGFCEIYIAPNTALYSIHSVERDGCGSLILTGSARTNEGFIDLEVTDNRARLCDDIVPALVVMKMGEETYYSADNYRES